MLKCKIYHFILETITIKNNLVSLDEKTFDDFCCFVFVGICRIDGCDIQTHINSTDTEESVTVILFEIYQDQNLVSLGMKNC